MALPKIDVPKFDLSIPGTDKKYTFRPFLVKENNILTQAVASNDLDSQLRAVVQIVENCCLENINIKDLPLYQLQWIFLQLKGKSVGEDQDFILTCGSCESKINYTMNINDFKIVGTTTESDLKIELNETSGIVFKVPSAEVQVASSKLSDFEVLINCIDHIYTEEEILKPTDIEIQELRDFIENLPLNVIEKAGEFFRNIPVLGHSAEFSCSQCNTKNRVVINGVEHFFG